MIRKLAAAVAGTVLAVAPLAWVAAPAEGAEARAPGYSWFNVNSNSPTGISIICSGGGQYYVQPGQASSQKCAPGYFAYYWTVGQRWQVWAAPSGTNDYWWRQGAGLHGVPDGYWRVKLVYVG